MKRNEFDKEKTLETKSGSAINKIKIKISIMNWFLFCYVDSWKKTNYGYYGGLLFVAGITDNSSIFIVILLALVK